MIENANIFGKYQAPTLGPASGIHSLQSVGLRREGGLWPVNETALPYTTNLFAHFDAADTSTIYDSDSGGSNAADAGAVGRIEDKSGNGRHLVQSVANNRPLLRSTKYNGRAAIEFDGSNDALAFVSAMPAACSFCFVVASTKTGSQVLFKEDDANPYFAFSLQGSGTASSSSAGSLRHYFNGVDITKLNAIIVGATFYDWMYPKMTTCALTNLALSAWSGLSVSGFAANVWQGFFCELVIYSENLSDTNRASVERYLRSKWQTG
jgi:hypothetical protein